MNAFMSAYSFIFIKGEAIKLLHLTLCTNVPQIFWKNFKDKKQSTGWQGAIKSDLSWVFIFPDGP